MELIFDILCGGLLLIGLAFGLNYEEISVYICIYLWPILCSLMVSMVAVAAIYRWILKNSFLNAIVASCSTFATYLFYKLSYQFIEYYELSGDNQNGIHQMFSLCMNDINIIARNIGMSYAEVNLYIYCYLFGIIMLMTWIGFEIIYPRKWLLNRFWIK